MIRHIGWVGAVIVLAAPAHAGAQAVFHSHQAANLPTAVTLPKGAWLFEISHRFGRFSGGSDEFWGLDGPVHNRLGLTYAPTSSLQLAVQRSNYQDNVDLSAKARVYAGGTEGVPVEVAVMGGVAWNTQVFVTEGATDNESQQYAQLILNAMLGGKMAVGLVPTWLRNPRIEDFDTDNAFVLGLNGQFYFADWASVLGEWAFSGTRPGQEHDSGTFGIELETRGHYFKLLVTNQDRLNPSQFLGGTPAKFTPDEWRFGFNITRLLPF